MHNKKGDGNPVRAALSDSFVPVRNLNVVHEVGKSVTAYWHNFRELVIDQIQLVSYENRNHADALCLLRAGAVSTSGVEPRFGLILQNAQRFLGKEVS